ncbi:MAG: hypothetical protein ACK55Z_27240 [bacterium]
MSARLQCSQFLWNCAKIKAVYRRVQGERGLDIAQTIGPNLQPWQNRIYLSLLSHDIPQANTQK